ncbi:hypothetical protein ACP70R_012067 [Stipagrostis hirtigluma subsp. patula]
MRIIVTKSSPELVGPSTPPAAPATGHINLSSFDKALAFYPMTAVYVFDRAIDKPAETLRRALSQALVHYFPIAGRAVVGADGEIRIACTGEGVAFVAASANCSLDDVKLFDPPFATLLKELLTGYGPEGCRQSDPLMLVQVTEFSCGGFVVGITRNHGICDGKGLAQFLHAVGEIAQGLPQPSVVPASRCGDSFPELPPLVAAIEEAMVKLEPQSFVNLDITIPSRLINRIKAEFVSCSDEPCSLYEAVVAVLWRCRARVVTSDPSTPAPLVFAANVRKLVGAKDGYYGNCITSLVVSPTSGEVANGDIKDVVRLIKRAKKQIPEQFKKVAGESETLTGHGGLQDVSMEQLGELLGYNALVVTSWRNLGHESVDFGGGPPVRVMCHLDHTAVPFCVACLPCKTKDGANVSALCVREEHADVFLGELAKLM